MEQLKIRKPYVAGQFYPSNPLELKKQISSFLEESAVQADALACLLPHAGYIYSGRVAGMTVSRIKVKDKVILLGPNHTGRGAAFSIMAEGAWQTPLGTVKIDAGLASLLLKNSPRLEDDILAHLSEHSLEVELPLLQYFNPNFQMVPIALTSDDFDSLKKLGEEIASAVKAGGLQDSVLLVASSDMTHYEHQEKARQKDKEAIDAILALDEERLVARVRKLNISMCGIAPVIVMLKAVKALGARSAHLVKYQTSGDVTGDRESVVGYAGVIISR
jgi:MEMO1 family protein